MSPPRSDYARLIIAVADQVGLGGSLKTYQLRPPGSGFGGSSKLCSGGVGFTPVRGHVCRLTLSRGTRVVIGGKEARRYGIANPRPHAGGRTRGRPGRGEARGQYDQMRHRHGGESRGRKRSTNPICCGLRLDR